MMDEDQPLLPPQALGTAESATRQEASLDDLLAEWRPLSKKFDDFRDDNGWSRMQAALGRLKAMSPGAHEEASALIWRDETMVGAEDERRCLDGVRALVTPEDYAAIEEGVTVLGPTMSRMREIEVAALDPASERLEEERQRILAETDWDKVIEEISGGEDGDVETMAYKKQLVNAVHEARRAGTRHDTLESVVMFLDAAARAYETLRSNGLLLSPERRQAVGIEQVVTDIWPKTREWMTSTSQAAGLLVGERKLAAKRRLNMMCKQEERLIDLSSTFSRIGEAHPSNIVSAIEARLGRIFAGYDLADQRMMEQLQVGRPNAVMVTGAKLLSATTDIKYPQAWTWDVLKGLPPAFYDGLGFVAYVPEVISSSAATQGPASTRLPDATPDTDSSQWVKSGNFDRTKNKLQVRVNADGFSGVIDDLTHRENAMTREDAEASLRRVRRKDAEGSLIHELTHYAMAHSMSVATLREWVRTYSKSPEPITAYEANHQKEPDNELGALKEALCETTAEFKTDPARLAWDAPERFQFANYIIPTYSAFQMDQIMNEAKSLRESGSSGKEAKERMYVFITLVLPTLTERSQQGSSSD